MAGRREPSRSATQPSRPTGRVVGVLRIQQNFPTRMSRSARRWTLHRSQCRRYSTPQTNAMDHTHARAQQQGSNRIEINERRIQ